MCYAGKLHNNSLFPSKIYPGHWGLIMVGFNVLFCVIIRSSLSVQIEKTTIACNRQPTLLQIASWSNNRNKGIMLKCITRTRCVRVLRSPRTYRSLQWNNLVHIVKPYRATLKCNINMTEIEFDSSCRLLSFDLLCIWPLVVYALFSWEFRQNVYARLALILVWNSCTLLQGRSKTF